METIIFGLVIYSVATGFFITSRINEMEYELEKLKKDIKALKEEK